MFYKGEKVNKLKKITMILLLFAVGIITACQVTKELKVELDLHNYKTTTSDEDYDVKLEVLENSFKLEIMLPTEDDKFNLVVNDIKINSNDFNIENNKLSYIFTANKFLDPESLMPYILNLELGRAMVDKDFLEKTDSLTNVTISEKEDQFTSDFSIFSKGRTGLKFHYKLFVKHYEEQDVYIPVFVDAMTKAIEEIIGIDYDYVITLNSGSQSMEEDINVSNLFKEEVLEKTIIFDKEIFSEGPLTMSVYNREKVSVKVGEDTNISLPTPHIDMVTFEGWSLNGNDILEVPSFKVKDNINILNIKPKWESVGINELYQYIDELIPQTLNRNLNLPTYFAGYEVVWESSNLDVLTNDGVFSIPYQETNLSLSVDITNLEGELFNREYNLESTFKKSLETPIASSYIYTSYPLVDSFFFETIDIINTAFLIANDNGSLIGLSFLRNVMDYIMPEAKKNGNWVILSIAPESSWSVFSKSDEQINVFADNIVNVINEYGFDGVDIDWETPKRGEEKQYTNLMKIVYEKVKRNNENHLVTTAITGGPYQPPMYDLENSHIYIDYLNIMTYGMIANDGGYQNALYTHTTYHNTEFNVGKTINQVSIDDSIKIFNNYGFKNEQLIVGVAFYSMKQTRTKEGNNWSTWKSAGSGYFQQMLALLENDEYEGFYDERVKVPYIVKKDGTEFYSYDDERSVLDKSEYVKDNNLGGIMFWEYGRDNTNKLLGAMKEGLNK